MFICVFVLIFSDKWKQREVLLTRVLTEQFTNCPMILCLLHSLFSHFKLKIKLANRIYNICLLIKIITLLLAQVIQLVQYLFVSSCLWYHAQGCNIYGETQKNLEGWQYRLIIRHDISLLNTIWMSSLLCWYMLTCPYHPHS